MEVDASNFAMGGVVNVGRDNLSSHSKSELTKRTC